jgi:hypothetical protein
VDEVARPISMNQAYRSVEVIKVHRMVHKICISHQAKMHDLIKIPVKIAPCFLSDVFPS